ncbi:MAG: hypothetical protein D3914_12030 [Candidatus Electrothrix sp. LOE2]|nr:hypothetical protein [Candidatus Electrothrix sp. LOE2]
MITRCLLKQEIDKVREEHLTALYNIIKVFGLPDGTVLPDADIGSMNSSSDWEKFIRETYGYLRDDPIERGNQGEYELREELQ